MKRLVFLIVILIATIKVYSQGYEIAVYTEPQFSWISSDEAAIQYNGTVFNLNTGIELDLFFADNYAFSMGVSLNNSGGQMLYSNETDFTQTGDTLTVPPGTALKHKLQYVSIPLGLKLKSEELGYTTFYFHGGLIPMISSNGTTSSLSPAYSRENIKPNIRMFNMNYFAEIGIEYRLGGNTAVVCGVKWSSGITDVTNNDLATNNINSVGLHLGILF